jgi:hypothetical protein
LNDEGPVAAGPTPEPLSQITLADVLARVVRIAEAYEDGDREFVTLALADLERDLAVWR